MDNIEKLFEAIGGDEVTPAEDTANESVDVGAMLSALGEKLDAIIAMLTTEIDEPEPAAETAEETKDESEEEDK